MAKRTQRKRAKGWKMPQGAVYVGRASKWGNPFVPGSMLSDYDIHKDVLEMAFPDGCDPFLEQEITLDDCLRLYRAWVLNRWEYEAGHSPYELRGKDLACWCRLCEVHKDGKPLGVECPDCDPCHADVLLELANAGGE